MANRDIVCIGASAGGVEVLRRIAQGLVADLPAALFVVLHTSPRSPRVLPSMLAVPGRFAATYAEDQAPVRRGNIYVAPPDYHLILEAGQVRVLRGPRQNRHRPSVDVLFRSAALAYGPRVIGIVVTGMMSDGAAGLAAIQRAGGATVVQDPAEAAYPDMPRNALAQVAVDHNVTAAEIPALLASLTREEVAETPETRDETLPIEVRADRGESDMEDLDHIGKRTVFTCPDCQGTLWEMGESDLVRYRCHVGHSYAADALAEHQDEKLEETLWSAVRAMEENASLSRRMSRRLNGPTGGQLLAKADDLEKHVRVLKRLLLQGRENVAP